MSTNDLTFTGDFPGVVARVRADSNAAFLRGDPSLDVAQHELLGGGGRAAAHAAR